MLILSAEQTGLKVSVKSVHKLFSNESHFELQGIVSVAGIRNAHKIFCREHRTTRLPRGHYTSFGTPLKVVWDLAQQYELRCGDSRWWLE